MKSAAASLPLLWKKEFTKGGIPSSIRARPSIAVERLAKFLTLENLPTLKGVDLGCGTGRNTLYLGDLKCDMTGVDFVPELVEELNKKADESGLTSSVRGQVVDLSGKWSLPEARYDFFMDTYCFKHIIDLAARLNYKSELLKYSSEGTIFLLTLASTEDGYYKQHGVRMEGGIQVILDPGNNIESLLYTPEQVVEFFNPEFKVVDMQENCQTNVMHGKEYDRKGFEFIFRRARLGI
jgi:SAM-dependent methyltransferase